MLIGKTRWHADADVIVVGYGAAGAVAAITAHDGGARVLILEKQEKENVISTSFMSGGSFVCTNDIQEAMEYMEGLYRAGENIYWTEPDVIRAWARYTSENRRWLEGMGGTGIELFHRGGEHNLPGFESIDVYHAPGMGGHGLMRLLCNQVNARGIQVMHHTRATDLLSNLKGEIVGVRAKSCGEEGKVITIRSRRAVILATGGFEFDEQMKLQYLKAYPTYFLGSPANTGDGIKMALGVGAQLWHMNCCSARLVMKFPELPVALAPAFAGGNRPSPGKEVASSSGTRKDHHPPVEEPGTRAGYIVVDRAGKRYTKETFKPHALYYELTGFDSQRLFYPRIPSYWIFDKKRMDKGPLVRMTSGAAGPAGLCRWSADNHEELERGWIKQGMTVEDLAQEMGIEPLTLIETVGNYDLYCKNGEDVEFGRQPATLVPLDTPPYYAVELWPGGPNTQGGPQRDGRARILNADGSPIPRLYSAGELGSIYGMLYPAGGGNLAECIAFGRIAGENASEDNPL